MSDKEATYSSKTMQFLAGLNRKQRRRLAAKLRPFVKKYGKVEVKTSGEVKQEVASVRPD